ncbi:sigma 54-interacting transcriptional regulator [Vibrio sp. SS-MA-C1-2]|uniref:sigma 54-interacting transcriptional regulator n=1 Tax=Vibrio sp. SS-MA-C1-2 TaxID=2908646 RepID=UPI001F17F9C1|nr:sigma 54-interacting transcriptional regulator [Vibrio sp. SS-MA-C1-2]UJF18579.1 sigma 54-interacting transcriptional regulator [Vibrio sp. SS-MA-C1-2]
MSGQTNNLNIQPVSELMKLQPTIIKFSKMLSAILKIDVEVVDANLVRIAGTGPYDHAFGQPLSTSSRLFRYIIENKKEKVVVKSHNDPLCIECQTRDNCQETAFIGVPILISERCIGVISLAAFNQQQQQDIQENTQTFTEYVRHIAQVFVTSLTENNKHNNDIDQIFIRLIEDMDQGVLVLDQQAHVRFGNQVALNYLNLTNGSLANAKVKIETLSQHHILDGHQQHIISLGSRQELVMGLFHQIKEQQLFLMSYFQPNHIAVPRHDDPHLSPIVGECKQMLAIKRLLSRIANSPSSVLIHGESGTGKEVIAKAIHSSSQSIHQPFIAINCAAIPEHLLESELFGYVKGAFTGASTKGKIGLIQAANKGTLFLDEIGDMSMSLQAKLLRVLEEREVMPIGANKAVTVDIRIISATNQDFHKMIQEGRFREDLYYRLNVIPVFLPPLRERDGDIDKLAHHFLDHHSRKIGVPYPGMTPETIEALNHYRWPGNVRELSNLMEYLINIVPTGETIDLDLLPPYIETQTPHKPSVSTIKVHPANQSHEETLEEMEAEQISKVLKRVSSRKIAAKELGIGIATLYRKIKKYQLNEIETP